MKTKKTKAELMDALKLAGREFCTSIRFLDDAIAAQLQLAPSDVRLLEVLDRKGEMTAGEIATYAGLTTGAVTAMVDRLEANGAVLRIPDPKDRRRVIVRLVTLDHCDLLIKNSTHERFRDLCGAYSEEQLEQFLDFISQASEIFLDEARKMSR